jgi:hypothetical protein
MTTKTTITVQGTRYPLIRITAKKALDVCGTHIYKGEIFFLVRSRKGSQEYLPVRWNYERCSWQCSCEMGCRMHKHIALCSMFSHVHPYSETHPAGCPIVVKSEQVSATEESDTFDSSTAQTVSSEVVDQAQLNSPVEPTGSESLAPSAELPSEEVCHELPEEITQLDKLLPGHRTCILKKGEYRYPYQRTAEGWVPFKNEKSEIICFQSRLAAQAFLANKKIDGQSARTAAFFENLPSRQAQIDVVKEEVLLLEKEAHIRKSLGKDTLKKLKALAESRGLNVKGRKQVYIEAILADMHKESEEVA